MERTPTQSYCIEIHRTLADGSGLTAGLGIEASSREAALEGLKHWCELANIVGEEHEGGQPGEIPAFIPDPGDLRGIEPQDPHGFGSAITWSDNPLTEFATIYLLEEYRD